MQTSDRSHVYLSPHLDDAVLSCGGTIYTQARGGERVLVVSIFAASPTDYDFTPFTRELRQRWGGAADTMAARRAEDCAALAGLGARALHLGYLDCVFRQHPDTGEPLYPTVEQIFAEVHATEATLADALYRDLRARLATHARARLYAPLGAGHHVDHQIVRRAAGRLLADGVDVALYEDWPYADDAAAVERALEGARGRWHRRVFALSEEALSAKGNAVARYASQISTFWSNLEAMRRALCEQAERVGSGGLGEGFWLPTPGEDAAEDGP